ncbi:MAG: DNA-binding protein [Anaerolineae bacterium]|nr:DNA-binding protein [Anaerolineae bacterium]
MKASFPAKLGQPALRALAAVGIANLIDFTKIKENDLAKLHGIGANALGKIKAALVEQGFSFLQ